MHQPAVANRSQQKWKRKIKPKNSRAQRTLGERNRMARTKRYVFIDATIFAKSDLTFGPAVKIIEDGARDATLGDGP
jgi:hypothetical protein